LLTVLALFVFFVYLGNKLNIGDDISGVQFNKEAQLLARAGTPEVKGSLTKTYDIKEKEVAIVDNEDLKFKAKLLTGYNQMVSAGKDIRVAEIQLIDWSSNLTGSVFDELYAFDVKQDYANIKRNFTLKYTTTTKTSEYTVDIPQEDGSTKQGTIKETNPDWSKAVAFKNWEDLPSNPPAGGIPIGIYTDTTLGESVEWVLALQGFNLYEWAQYDVSQIDVLEHDTVDGGGGSLVMIDSTHFILAYTGAAYDGYIKTFSIDGSYDNITQIDVLEHDTLNGTYNSLVMIDSTHFILAYAGDGFDGYIKTFSIDGNYDNIAQIDSLEHDTANGTYNSLVMIDSTHFILAYEGGSWPYGYIRTFSIDGSYDNITVINTLQHDDAGADYNSLVMIDSTHFILAYASFGGKIKTFSIDGSYAVTQIDSLQHETELDYSNSLVMIDSTHFILAYTGAAYDGYIKTFSIDGSYNITQIDVLEHDTVSGWDSSLVMIDSTHFILAYTGPADDGYIKTFSIDGSYGNITEINSLEHDTSDAWYNNLIKIDSTHFMLEYEGVGADGFLKTFAIEGPPLVPSKNIINSGGKVKINSGGKFIVN